VDNIGKNHQGERRFGANNVENRKRTGNGMESIETTGAEEDIKKSHSF